MTDTITAQRMSRFRPIHLVAFNDLALLCENSEQLEYLPGQNILDSMHMRKHYHFLVSGEIAIQSHCRFVKNLTDSLLQCENPLEELITKNQKIYATSRCTVLRVDRNFLESLLSSRAANQGAPKAGKLAIHQETNQNQGTWLEKILQSSLADQLSTGSVHKLLSAFEMIEVTAEQEIIHKGDQGDYFYVIREGQAAIELADGGEITLSPGNYFGEEALVVNNLRNANVKMKTDGVLNRLSRDNFENIVKRELVKVADDPHKIMDIRTGKSISDVVLDIRDKSAVAQQPIANSVNIPVNELREHLRTMDNNSVYYISDDGNDQCELAAFLLRMSGKNAYLLPMQGCA